MLRLHQVVHLEDALLHQLARRQLLALRVLGTETHVNADDVLLRRVALDRRRACQLVLDRRVERPQTVQLHRLTLRDHLRHTLHHLLKHQHHHLVVRQLAVARHVGTEALQRQRLLRLGLAEVLAVRLRRGHRVLPQVYEETNFISCHNCKCFS